MEYHIDYRQIFADSVSFEGNSYHTLDDGTTLHVQTDPGIYIHISVYPPTDPPAQCWAEIRNDILTIAAFTRDKFGNPLTDFLYMKEFFDYSIHYFGLDNIIAIKGDLNPTSVVRSEIIRTYEETGDLQYSAETCKLARMASQYGFRLVDIKVFPPKNPDIDPWGAMELTIYKND